MKGMSTDEDAQIVGLMREAIEKSRGYASYWEWKPDKRQAEIHAAQVLSYLKATRLPLGLLINFNVPLLKSGIKRIILS